MSAGSKRNGHGPPRVPGDHVAALSVTAGIEVWCYIEGRNWLLTIGGFAEGAGGPQYQPSRVRILPTGDDLAPLDLTLSVFAETYKATTNHDPPNEAKASKGVDDQVESAGMDFDRIVGLVFVADGFRYSLQFGNLRPGPAGKMQLVSDALILRPAVEGQTTAAILRLGDLAKLYRIRTGTRIVLPPTL